MPMPGWWRHLNKYFFNPLAMKFSSPALLTHTGRSSGKSYTTPIDALAVEGGFTVALIYTSNSDWVKNILHSGSATLSLKGQVWDLSNPHIVDFDTIKPRLGADASIPPAALKINEYLVVDATLAASPL